MFNNNPTLQSLSWTMVHSLWQGLILAFMAALVIVCTRSTSARLRYNLLATLGIAFVATTAFTFYHHYTHFKPSQPATSTSGLDFHQPFSPVLVTYHDLYGPQQPVPGAQNSPSIIASVAGFLDDNAPYIVALWFLFFAFKCVQLFRSLRHIQVLKHDHLRPVTDYWNQRFFELRQNLDIKGRVLLMESALIQSPAVIGFFKPMVLLPLGLLTNMPTAEAEAILLHELAHIRRKDYLFNLIQGLAETVFFFNPGFMWLSALLRTEREHCCDDLAIAITRSKTGFVQALVTSQEYAWRKNQLALGFGQEKTPLLDRTKRILYNRNQTLNNMEKTFLSVCVVLGLCVAFAFGGHTENQDVLLKTISSSSVTNPMLPAQENQDKKDGDPNDHYLGKNFKNGMAMLYYEQHNGNNQPVYVFKHHNTVYQVTGDIRELKVNGEIIPQENWKKYMPVVEDLMERYRKGLAFTPGDSLVAPPAPPAPPLPPNAPLPPVPPVPPLPPMDPSTEFSAESMKLLAQLYAIEDDSLRNKKMTEAERLIAIEMKEVEKQMREAEIEMKKAAKEMEGMDEVMRQAELEMKKAEIEMAKAKKEMARAQKEIVLADKEMKKAEIEMHRSEAILEDLEKETGQKITSYELSDKTLIVNGKKQSDELQERMSKKYLKGKKGSIVFKTDQDD